MNDESKNLAKQITKTGVRTIGDIIVLVLKIIGAVLLTGITTGIIFACIFAVYVKTNLSDGLDIRLEDYAMTMSLSSVISYKNPQTGAEEELVTLQSNEFRIWVEYEDIPKNVIHALVAIEDKRFYKHHGVDWYRTVGAFGNMFLSMKDTFGGSTITQQLIKNLTSEDEATVKRKLVEIFRALELEKEYSKEDIIELYLNYVYFGHGCHGIGAAADYYFGKEVSELTLAESAAIIGITNNPSIYSPYVSRTENKKRQERILKEMYDQNYILTERSYKSAVNEKLDFQRGDSNEYVEVTYTWFEEAVINDVIRDLMEKKGYPEKVAKGLLYYGGYKIVATIDLDMQEKVDSIYQNSEEIPETTGSSQRFQSSIVIADPYTGEIKALSGGVGKKTGNMLLNRATMTRRPPGSSFKPLAVYAPAIDAGLITPDTRYDDSPTETLEGDPTYMPKNYDRQYRGIVDIRRAVRSSLNTIAAQVLDDLKPSYSYRFVKDTLGFGLDDADEAYAPLALGQLTYGATVREMAAGFTMFPNSGEFMETYTYTKVYDSEGVLILENKPKPVRAISETAAYWMTDLLTDAVMFGTGSEAKLENMPVAGKTGSTTDLLDRWFVGYTPYYVAAVWTGYDIPDVITLKNGNGNPAAQIWKKVMTLIHEDLETKQFNVPGNIELAPVEGIALVEYTIRCVDTEGNVLREELSKAAVDREIREQAPEIEGYNLAGDAESAIKINDNPSRNVITFVYEAIAVETEPPDDMPPDELPPVENPQGDTTWPWPETPSTETPSAEPPPSETPSTEPPPAESPPAETEEPPDVLPPSEQETPDGAEQI